MGERRRLAVLGSPISHSLSPRLHLAAYRHLGLDWSYDRIEMTADTLPAFLDGLGPEWRGLSLTMPVKNAVIPFLQERDELVELTQACNTAVFESGRWSGYNTDVTGIVTAFRSEGVDDVRTAVILGGGATAASALTALASLGAREVTVAVRDPRRAAGLLSLGETLSIRVQAKPLEDRLALATDAVVSTLPSGALVAGAAESIFPAALRKHAVLFDVAYDPWPSSLAQLWHETGGRVISGFEMLLHQAVAQVRIFAGDGIDTALSDEAAMRASMREAALHQQA